jgi:hypothetical protein
MRFAWRTLCRYGAEVHKVAGLISDAGAIVGRACKKHGYFGMGAQPLQYLN